jgi:SAM-dependent methyltransferase
VSSYALSQEADLHGLLTQCDIQSLPVRTGAADVVLALDVLEHLPDPVRGLQEAVRVLAPDGLLVGATPDPIFFDRSEETHFSERPPSFWIRRLVELGFYVAFRFSEVPYNFQFLACRNEGPLVGRVACFQHDYFSRESEFAVGEGIRVVPRWGWGTRNGAARPIEQSGASVYLLNESPGPVSCEVELSVITEGGFSTLGVRLDSWLLGQTVLNSESAGYRIRLESVLVPSGGHHLFFDLSPEGPAVNIANLKVLARPCSSRSLVVNLPFDLFQRYEGVAELLSVVRPDSLLDVGGYIGDAEGHLAVSSDFLQNPECTRLVRSTDFRHCDHPDHLASDGSDLPYDDSAFDGVVSLDVLEHIRPDRRETFLDELGRVSRSWVVIAAPFFSAEVERAEGILSGGIMSGHRFLEEHRQLGLPRPDEIRDYCASRGYPFWDVENGNLNNWLLLQTLNALFFGTRLAEIARAFNRLYNEQLFPADHSPPCYRTIFLIYTGEGSPENRADLSLKVAEVKRARLDRRWGLGDLAREPRFHELFQMILSLNDERARALTDVQFLANARTDHIELLLEERHALIEQLEHTPLAELAKRRWKQRREQSRKKQDE